MPNPMSVHIPADILERLDALAARLRALPQYAPFRMNRSTALRMALLRGLDLYEAEFGTKPKPKPRGK